MLSRNSYPFPFPLEKQQIICKRAAILSSLLATDEGFCCIPALSIREQTLKNMLSLYDMQFFDGFLSRKLKILFISLSPRLTSSAGKFICTKGPFGRIKTAEIRMSSDYLTRLTEGPFLLNGLSVQTPQEVFLVVFEHELCHAVETVIYGKTGHSQRFLSLANGLFGHTQTRHCLPTRKQEAAQSGLIIGTKASFLYQNQELTGVITYIGKTATVMVPDINGEYRDRRGNRYAKFRVSPKNLHPQ